MSFIVPLLFGIAHIFIAVMAFVPFSRRTTGLRMSLSNLCSPISSCLARIRPARWLATSSIDLALGICLPQNSSTQVRSQFDLITRLLSSVSLTSIEDCVIWKASSDSEFSTASFDQFLNSSGITCRFASTLWNLSVPPKIHCFLWLCWKHKLNTRDTIDQKLGKFLRALGTLCPQSTFRYTCSEWAPAKFPKSSLSVSLMLFSAVSWKCWRERNARLFLNKASSVQTVAWDALSLFKDWSIFCNSCQLKSSTCSSLRSSEPIPPALQESIHRPFPSTLLSVRLTDDASFFVFLCEMRQYGQ
ncbi:uncharacterized protein [Elaeis guineensis]|uniref:Uncharacterized protein LOC105052751 isoform X2 n=1 Tax=Elaeis guineensis var. tenera TaxID=51953 RepID=A0A6J0PN26_ELAGV|nr:uncharacterized protein LOC105052751 isoform X2 [Elaeis guineensis]